MEVRKGNLLNLFILASKLGSPLRVIPLFTTGSTDFSRSAFRVLPLITELRSPVFSDFGQVTEKEEGWTVVESQSSLHKVYLGQDSALYKQNLFFEEDFNPTLASVKGWSSF